MKLRQVLIILFIVIILTTSYILTTSCIFAKPQEINNSNEIVSIINKETHYEVTLNMNNVSHKALGEEYAKSIIRLIPDYESTIDSYLAEISSSDDKYNLFITRTKDIKPQIPKSYCDEIEGMAQCFSGNNSNIRGDGKLSLDEIYLLNLIPDVARGTQCSALSVYKGRSATKNTITGRILDWYQGSQNQLTKIQSVTTFKNGAKSICSIGYLGYLGIISGFNNDKVFAAILDSPSGSKYTSTSKYSYPMDIRYALENKNTLKKVSTFLKSDNRKYTMGHLIILSNPENSVVLENNISDDINFMPMRAIRTEDSELNEGIEWAIDNAIGTVNSFLLKNNYNNHSSQLSNTERFKTLKEQLLSKGNMVTVDELKEIVTYFNGENIGVQTNGSLYNTRTQQIIVFEPKSYNLEVFFRPFNGLPLKPSFEKIEINFN